MNVVVKLSKIWENLLFISSQPFLFSYIVLKGIPGAPKKLGTPPPPLKTPKVEKTQTHWEKNIKDIFQMSGNKIKNQ